MSSIISEGDGQSTFSDTKAFQELEAPHAKVHNSIHEVIHLIGEDWEKHKEIKDQIIQAYESAEQGSDQVMLILDKMVQQKQ